MRIIVGVDDSRGSRAALRYALRESAEHDAELVVLHAWLPAFEYVHATQTTDVLRAAALQQATELLDGLLAEARAERRWGAERVTARPVEGEPSAALLAAARDGDLLVVGTNRGGLVRRLLLGSVSSEVVRSATGPVVVVPAPPRRDRGERRERRHRGRPAAVRSRGPLTPRRRGGRPVPLPERAERTSS